MLEHRIETMTDTGVSGARRVIESAQDAAARTGSYVRTRVSRMSGQAQDLAVSAGDHLASARGVVASWAGSARRLVKEHPLQAMMATVGVGYVIGKLVRRR